MRALDQLESFLQGLMERPAGLLMPRGLQPVQLANALTRAIEDRALRLSDRIVIPNRYVLSMSLQDYAQIGEVRTTLEHELAEYIERLAAERELSLPDDPEVRIRSDRELLPGRTPVQASFPPTGDGAPGRRSAHPPPSPPERPAPARAPGPALALLASDGAVLRRFLLAGPSMTLGRRSSNDIPLPDLKISRRHARLDLRGAAWYLTDLDSTNGTSLNGQDVGDKSRLEAGDIIEVGLQRLRFETQTGSRESRT